VCVFRPLSGCSLFSSLFFSPRFCPVVAPCFFWGPSCLFGGSLFFVVRTSSPDRGPFFGFPFLLLVQGKLLRPSLLALFFSSPLKTFPEMWTRLFELPHSGPVFFFLARLPANPPLSLFHKRRLSGAWVRSRCLPLFAHLVLWVSTVLGAGNSLGTCCFSLRLWLSPVRVSFSLDF